LHVPTLANLDALFDADPQIKMVDHSWQMKWARSLSGPGISCVPPQYVPMLLGQVLMLREVVYIRLSGAINAGLEVDCALLLMYLRSSCLHSAIGQVVPTIQCQVAPILCMDAPLFAHIHGDNIVHRDLPWLQEPAHLEPSLHVAGTSDL
jgi:hypothetical protein